MKKLCLLGGTGIVGTELRNRLSLESTVSSLGRSSLNDIIYDSSQSAGAAVKELISEADILVDASGVTNEEVNKSSVNAFERLCNVIALIETEANQLSHIVYISTSHVYGRFEGELDELKPVNPIGHYSLIHYFAEQEYRRIAEKKKAKLTIVRPNAVYGLPSDLSRFDRWSLIPFSFPKEAVKNSSITIMSSGLQKRNFVSSVFIAELVAEALQSQNESVWFINPVGKKTLTVGGFSKLVAQLCEDVLEKRVEVSIKGTEPKICDFSFKSNRTFSVQESDNSLEKFLISLITKIKEEVKDGANY